MAYEGVMVFDIETIGNEEMHRFMPESGEMPEFGASKNWRDPAKIAAYIEQKQADWQMKQAEKKLKWLDKMPVDIDYAAIRCIGISTDRDSPPLAFSVGQTKESAGMIGAKGDLSEADLLVWFWKKAQSAYTVAGYNVLGFDIPIIMRRSWVLGVEPSRDFDLRPWGKDVVDVMRKLYHDGYGPGPKYRGLKAVVEMYGIETEWDVEEVDGSMVADLSIDDLNAYCISDVARTRELLFRMKGVYW